jgi:hypothetical protein
MSESSSREAILNRIRAASGGGQKPRGNGGAKLRSASGGCRAIIKCAAS